MTESIYLEARLFLAAFLLGIILIFIYDILRILRRIIIHNLFFIALEDFLFWCGAGLICFGLMFWMYQGRMRAFYFIGLFLGMALYHFNLSPVVVEPITKIIKKTGHFIKNIILFFVKPAVKAYKKWKIKNEKREKARKAARQEKIKKEEKEKQDRDKRKEEKREKKRKELEVEKQRKIENREKKRQEKVKNLEMERQLREKKENEKQRKRKKAGNK